MSAFDSSTTGQSAARRLAITVRGVVQGVGFRPFVYNAARAESLSGWVLNEADAVRMEVQGSGESIDRFLGALQQHPPQARIDELNIQEITAETMADEPVLFQIRKSSGDSAPRPTIPADLATCPECQREIRDPNERRCQYPFTNCTNCGPRWSIIEQLPYDRPRTSMRRFTMCDDCQTEYEDPTDRRFHAQPIACPACGPELQLVTCDRTVVAERDSALAESVQAVLAGKILALKGLGGFQLVADATDQAAVQRLRDRKQRVDKPFAVMMETLAAIQERCIVSEDEQAALQSPAAPILLLRRRQDPHAVRDIAESIALGNPHLGVMLPYTPLHHLLIAGIARPIVCTSGNLSEEPMAISTEDAVQRLGDIADAILTHNRPIVRPVDDSVARVGPDGVQVMRRARGFAPLAINVGSQLPTILAVGGHLKNTVALSLGSDVVITPHVGDLDSTLSVDVHRRAIDDLVGFFEVTPDAVACDLHPDYASTRHAEQLSARWEVPLLQVQHHHAHVASCVAEHKIDGPVLGFAWDGTGYGLDHTVWGGEVLRCEDAQFTRVAYLRTFRLPGGDQAVREPRRSALGVLFEMMGEDAAELIGSWFSPAELGTLFAALERPKLFPRTSSLGRLFDTVAALCSLSERVTFEGQAAMALEFAVDAAEREAYPLPLSIDSPAVADWEPLIRGVLDDRTRGVPVARIAARFHNALADLALAAATRVGCDQIVLTGGCFQNAVLAQRVRERLLENDFRVYTHSQVPPGDGGIAVGQVFIAARRMKEPPDVSRNTG